MNPLPAAIIPSPATPMNSSFSSPLQSNHDHRQHHNSGNVLASLLAAAGESLGDMPDDLMPSVVSCGRNRDVASPSEKTALLAGVGGGSGSEYNFVSPISIVRHFVTLERPAVPKHITLAVGNGNAMIMGGGKTTATNNDLPCPPSGSAKINRKGNAFEAPEAKSQRQSSFACVSKKTPGDEEGNSSSLPSASVNGKKGNKEGAASSKSSTTSTTTTIAPSTSLSSLRIASSIHRSVSAVRAAEEHLLMPRISAAASSNLLFPSTLTTTSSSCFSSASAVPCASSLLNNGGHDVAAAAAAAEGGDKEDVEEENDVDEAWLLKGLSLRRESKNNKINSKKTTQPSDDCIIDADDAYFNTISSQAAQSSHHQQRQHEEKEEEEEHDNVQAACHVHQCISRDIAAVVAAKTKRSKLGGEMRRAEGSARGRSKSSSPASVAKKKVMTSLTQRRSRKAGPTPSSSYVVASTHAKKRVPVTKSRKDTTKCKQPEKAANARKASPAKKVSSSSVEKILPKTRAKKK